MIIKIEKPTLMVKLYQKFLPSFERRLTQVCTDKMKIGDLPLLIVAREGDEIVGVTGTYEDGTEVKGFTVVLKEYRRRGIGTHLLKFRYEFFPNINTYVWEGNKPCVRMCLRAGLRHTAMNSGSGIRVLKFVKNRYSW